MRLVRSVGNTALVLFAVTLGCSSTAAVRKAHPVIGFEPLALDFGTVIPGASTTKSLTLQNTGDVTLLLEAVRLTGDRRSAFMLGPAPSSIPAGGSAKLAVTYFAPAEGPDGAQIVIDSNADNAPEAAVTLSGRTQSNCAAGQTECGGVCIDEQSDALNCGACGRKCDANMACKSGRCVCVPATCTAGACGALSDGCGATLDCGGCPAVEACVANRCAPRGCTADAQCPAGQWCTHGDCAACNSAGAPVDTQNDPANCGACANACPTPVHSVARCVKGACGRAPCDPGFYDLGTAFGCAIHCAAHVCVDDAGKVAPVTNPLLPETGVTFSALTSGGSYGAAVQTSAEYTNFGALGESTPPNEYGAAAQSNEAWTNHGGVGASLAH